MIQRFTRFVSVAVFCFGAVAGPRAAAGIQKPDILLIMPDQFRGDCLSVLGHDHLRYAGDDYVAVSVDQKPWVHSLYCSGKIDPDNVARLPHLQPIIANADRLDREKAVIYANDSVPGSAVAGFPLRAILIPRIVDRPRSGVLPTSSAAAVTALAPSTMLQLHPPQAEALGRIRRVAAVVPAFVLELGADVAALPETLRQLLDSLDSA